MPLSLTVNGVEREVAGAEGWTLLEVLRDRLGVTGPKLGCGEGACGACTVLIGRRAVQACQVPAAEAEGQRVTTVEGLAEDGILHPVQQAWLETGAMQCGYCTPGWLVGTAALLARVSHPGDHTIDAELAGHVCRCCAYPRIRRAVHRAAELMDNPELLEPVPATSGQPPAPDPGRPWDLAGRDPGSFAAAMPEGLLTVATGRGDDPDWAPDDAWVHVGADSSVTAYTGKVESGQGTRTALSLLVGGELALPAGWVRVTMADTDVSPFDEGTFGSRSMPHAAPPLRAAAAAALRVLRAEAAARFGLPEADLTAADGMIAGPDGAPSASYGELVAGQRRVEVVPDDGPVTPATAGQTAGQPAHPARTGGHPAWTADVVTGAKVFPSDLRLDGMLHGCVLRPPAHGATLSHVDTTAAEAMPGVTMVKDGPFIGVVATDPHTARAALAAIDVGWQEPPGPQPDGLDVYLREHPVADEGRWPPCGIQNGNPRATLASGDIRLDAHYGAAYVAHVPLEPRAALARWDSGRLTVWAATSTPFRARKELAAGLGIGQADVQVIVPDFGGGFGGKHGAVVALEAARLARAVGRPVKVAWSRADEFTAGYLRPAAVIDVASSATEDGQITAWSFTDIHAGSAGLATPYRIENQLLVYQPAAGPLARGSYRALAATANNFARESHMDELAAAVGADPVAFRLRHLDDARLAAVLEAAADGIGWADETEAGTGTGIALGFEKDGRVATAARVRVGPDGTLALLRLVTAVDCGAVVHPDGLANQVEGAVAMGLGPALFERIDFAAGRILNGSMTGYRVPRLADVPADLEVILLDQPGQPSVGGGEVPLIAVAPAIANAIFRACGVRLRSMPLVPGGRVPASSSPPSQAPGSTLGGGRPARGQTGQRSCR
jgi:nicotinate dehydrogenase subunit B